MCIIADASGVDPASGALSGSMTAEDKEYLDLYMRPWRDEVSRLAAQVTELARRAQWQDRIQALAIGFAGGLSGASLSVIARLIH